MRRFLSILVLSLLLPAAYTASAQDTSAQTTRRARLEQEIAIIDGQLRENATRNSNALNTLSLVQQKIELRRGLIKEGEQEIARLDGEMRRKQMRIDSLQVRLDTMTFYYNKLVKGAYKNRDARVWYMYILASENLAQGLRRYSFLKNLSREMNSQGVKIKAAKEVLEGEKEQLAGMRAEAAELQKARMAELETLRREEATAQQTIQVLKKEKSKYQSQLNSNRKEVEALNKEIARIIAEAMNTKAKSSGSNKKSSSSSSKAAAAPIDYTLGKEFSSNKGKLPWPAEGPVVEKFGAQYHPVYTQLKLPDSEGISIALSNGAQVKAVFDGVVKSVIVQPGYNKCVLVQHGDYFTFYCKLGTVSVKAGDKVKTGQVLGAVEPIGGSTQLHFQLWSSKGPQNPVPWLRPR
ncbi:MAG: peptidoglycan DD-metalloendopeptidase family protein [Bacteroidales bacterium]|nr:peptidoglycan DD-metalloendopeptidase family protein [Bacteroidales bacterium]